MADDADAGAIQSGPPSPLDASQVAARKASAFVMHEREELYGAFFQPVPSS